MDSNLIYKFHPLSAGPAVPALVLTIAMSPLGIVLLIVAVIGGVADSLPATGRVDADTEVVETNVASTEEELNTAWVNTRDELL